MREQLEVLPQHTMSGNLVSKKAMNRAIQAGVAEGCPDEMVRNRVGGAISHMTPEALGDILPDIAGRPDALELTRDIGFINAAVIALPSLKTTTGKGVASYNTLVNTQLLRELSQKLVDPSRNLEVTIALGGSEQAPSLRLPTYIQPALDIATIFMQRDRQPPVVRIVNAFQISSALNGLDSELAERRAAQSEDLMRGYIEAFYPELMPHVEMERLTFEEVTAKTVVDDVEMLKNIMNAEPQRVTKDEKEAQQALHKLRRAAAKHYQGADQTDIDDIICGYAATHGLAYHNYGYADVAGVIKIGGRGEASFDVIQQFMANAYAELGTVPVANRTKGNGVQLTSLRNIAGAIPPYYPEVSQATGVHELTVDTDNVELPETLEAMIDLYESKGLLSASDLRQIPSHIAPHYVDFLRGYLNRRITV